jgi:hypothetical protein
MADAEKTRVEYGIDTLIFRDGLIRLQTVRYTVQHKSGTRRSGPAYDFTTEEIGIAPRGAVTLTVSPHRLNTALSRVLPDASW